MNLDRHIARTPCIGVTSSLGGGRYMWWFYWLSLRLFGERPVRLVPPGGNAFIHQLDGLIIGGGDDIGAELYRGALEPDVRIDPARDQLELHALEHAVPRDIPVLGICRGAQMLNVFYGGTLHEDIHRAYQDVPKRWTPLPAKRVHVAAKSRLRHILRADELRVNSLHTQSVDRLGTGLVVNARDEHQIVQGIEDPAASFRLGVQWHPEFMIYKGSQRRLFREFVRAVDARSARAHGLDATPGGEIAD